MAPPPLPAREPPGWLWPRGKLCECGDGRAAAVRGPEGGAGTAVRGPEGGGGRPGGLASRGAAGGRGVWPSPQLRGAPRPGPEGGESPVALPTTGLERGCYSLSPKLTFLGEVGVPLRLPFVNG